MEELTFFNYDKVPLKIDKPIRLIELFAGIGSQAKALERLGAEFEHYRVCEFDKYAIKSYNAIHGTNFETSDITQLTADDLGIVDTDKYCYLMTYSFPCQDLSLAGKQKGMAKGDNTRSGLLWEVERLLNECTELPQILLMENVTQVHGKKNMEHFQEWIDFLESKGYSNYWKDLNAKNFGIPQNRNRTFMVSVLGNYTYEFPQEFPLVLRLKDMLEDSVDEKYYISDKGIEYVLKREGKYTQLCDDQTEIAKSAITAKGNANWTGNFVKGSAVNGDVCKTVRAGGRGSVDRHSWDLVAEEPRCQQVGMLAGGKWDKLHDISRRVYSGEGVAPTIHTSGGGQQEPKVLEPTITVVGNYSPSGHDASRIVDAEGLAPTVKENHGTVTAVAEPLAYDEQNGYIRKYGTVGTLTTDGSSPKHNNRVVEPVRLGYIPYPNSDKPHQSNTFYDADAISPTLDTCEGGNRQVKIAEPQIIREEPLEREGWHGYAKEVLSVQGVCRTLSTQSNNLATKVKEPCTLRIRKLTPKECWRLMGFDDADFEKAAQYNSNSQLYKQAGNSIVVDVLAHIFTQML
jgi:DNA (cytosine-5)-methyltransferase 1